MGDPMKRNSEGLEMQKWNTSMDRAQKVDERNGFICLVFMFTLGDMMIKMPKMAHFLYFLLMAVKNQSQIVQNIQVHLVDFV